MRWNRERVLKGTDGSRERTGRPVGSSMEKRVLETDLGAEATRSGEEERSILRNGGDGLREGRGGGAGWSCLQSHRWPIGLE